MNFQFHNLEPLVKSMKRNNKSLEQFQFTYNKFIFDCILDIGASPFEIMLGISGKNFACILFVQDEFITEMADEDYYNLRDILNLNWNEHHFSSFLFLRILDSHFPSNCSPSPVPIEHIIPFRASQLSESEREEGYIFAGWLPHKGKNNGHARNINKTRLLLGNSVAEYCERNDISSKWTTRKEQQQKLTFPWDCK